MPKVRYSLIDAVCQESRRAIRAISMIESLNNIARGVPALQRISDKYRNLLQREMDSFRELSLAELNAPSEELLIKIGLASRNSRDDEAQSLSHKLYRKWLEEFREAYDVI